MNSADYLTVEKVREKHEPLIISTDWDEAELQCSCGWTQPESNFIAELLTKHLNDDPPDQDESWWVHVFAKELPE